MQLISARVARSFPKTIFNMMTDLRQYSYGSVREYTPPQWAESLKVKPSAVVPLIQLPTPIHPWSPPGLPEDFELSIKRDDLTGSVLSGNKSRRAEFILAEAKKQGCDSIVGLGDTQSNYARVISVAARQLGLEPHLILFHRELDKVTAESLGCEGNLMLNRLMGATFILRPYPVLGSDKEWSPIMREITERYCNKIRKEGRNPYCIASKEAKLLGVWGYIEAWSEMMEQGVLERFDDVMVCAGSGGTVLSLAVANYLTGSKVKVHAVSVTRLSELHYKDIGESMETLGVSVPSHELADIIDGYIGKGYGTYTNEDLRMVVDVSAATGVVLDPVYTVKAVHGMLSEMRNNPSRFRGRRVLYIHTGGLLGLFTGQLDQTLTSNT